MSEAGPLPLDLGHQSIYLFEVGADEKEGRIFCGRTHWREDLGGLPLPMQCHCRLQDPLTQVPSELENLPSALNRDVCKNLFSIDMAKIDNGQRPKEAICQKADQRSQRQKNEI